MTTNVPIVTGVSATDGLYGVDTIIDITVTFNEAVDVTGTPQITLETGTVDAVAGYTPTDSTGTALIFQYTIAAGHNSDDLNYIDVDPLSLNGGTIISDADNSIDASLRLPATGTATSLGGSAAVIVDTRAPTVSISSTGNSDGDTISTFTASYTVTFNEAVTGFDVEDIEVSGTAFSTLGASNFETATADISYTFDVVDYI